MDKSGLLEISKRFKYADCSITGLSYVVVPTAGQDEAERAPLKVNGKFLTLPDDERKKFLGILSQAFSLSSMYFHSSVKVDADVKKALSVLSRQDVPDGDLLLSLHDQLCRKYESLNSYALLAFSDTYDIPDRDTAKQKTGESTEVYNYIAVLLCPIKPEKGGLTVRDGAFHSSIPVSILQAPVLSFIYPDYVNRTPDEDATFICVKRENESVLLSDFFGVTPALPENKDKGKDQDKNVEGNENKGDGDVDEDDYIVPTKAVEVPSDKTPIPQHATRQSPEVEAMLDDLDKRRDFMRSKGIEPSFSSNSDSNDDNKPNSGQTSKIEQGEYKEPIQKHSEAPGTPVAESVIGKDDEDDNIPEFEAPGPIENSPVPQDDDDEIEEISFKKPNSLIDEDEDDDDDDYDEDDDVKPLITGGKAQLIDDDEDIDEDESESIEPDGEDEDRDIPLRAPVSLDASDEIPEDVEPADTPEVTDVAPDGPQKRRAKIIKSRETGKEYYMLPVDKIPYEKIIEMISSLGIEDILES